MVLQFCYDIVDNLQESMYCHRISLSCESGDMFSGVAIVGVAAILIGIIRERSVRGYLAQLWNGHDARQNLLAPSSPSPHLATMAATLPVGRSVVVPISETVVGVNVSPASDIGTCAVDRTWVVSGDRESTHRPTTPAQHNMLTHNYISTSDTSANIYHNSGDTPLFVGVSVGVLPGGADTTVRVYSDASATPTTLIAQPGMVGSCVRGGSAHAAFCVAPGNYYKVQVDTDKSTEVCVRAWVETY